MQRAKEVRLKEKSVVVVESVSNNDRTLATHAQQVALTF
jgi:hypothetical protein